MQDRELCKRMRIYIKQESKTMKHQLNPIKKQEASFTAYSARF